MPTCVTGRSFPVLDRVESRKLPVMANHNIFCIGFGTANPDEVEAASSISGGTDLVTVPPGETAGLISAISDAMGITFSNLSPAPGDTVSVVGPVGQIPDYQLGMFLVAASDGRCYFPNAGHLAEAFSL